MEKNLGGKMDLLLKGLLNDQSKNNKETHGYNNEKLKQVVIRGKEEGF